MPNLLIQHKWAVYGDKKNGRYAMFTDGEQHTDPFHRIPIAKRMKYLQSPMITHFWYTNYEANKRFISEETYANHEPSCETVIVVAAGPSLEKNIDLLNRIKTNEQVKVIGVNSIIKFLPCHDYFFTMDFRISPKMCFSDGQRSPCGVLMTIACPDLATYPQFDRVIWLAADISAELYAPLGWMHKDIPDLTLPANTTMAAMEWAAVYLKAKRIIMIGQDLSFKLVGDKKMLVHYNGEPEPILGGLTTWMDYTKEVVLTHPDYTEIAKRTMPFMHFLRDAGVDVINATEGGILTEECTILSLQETIDKIGLEVK